MKAEVRATGIVNVRDFGAKGNGRTDDTKAIQAALAAAARRTRTEPDSKEIGYPDGIPTRCGYHYHSTGPEVFFPAGHYTINGVLCPEGVDTLRGSGHAWIEQRNPDKDIFYSSRAIRQVFHGLTFKGGQSHLNLGNSNEDNGFVVVENCKFYNGKGVAIRMRENSNSTILMIQQCQVVACEQIVVSFTDLTHMRDCWLTGGRSRDGALIVTRHDSNFTMENICGVPLVNGHDQRWIDNYGTLICRTSRFGGEEAGFTPIVNFAKHMPQSNANMVVLDGCWLVCALGNNKRKCAVYCEEIPNRIDIRNCNLIGIPPVLVSDTIDPRVYFKARPGMLKYTVEDNVGEFAGEIPALLAKPRINPPATVKVLNQRQTQMALRKARQYWQRQTRATGCPAERFEGHRRRTKPDECRDISPSRCTWDTGDYMDGTRERCSAYVAVTEVAGQGIIVRRASGRAGVGPHVTVRDVAADLDRYPYLSWKMASNGTPAGLAVKVVDQSSGRAVLLQADKFDPFSYRAYNLRTLFGLRGKQKFDLKLYYGGDMYKGSRRMEDIVYAEAGDSVAFNFIRMEADE